MTFARAIPVVLFFAAFTPHHLEAAEAKSGIEHQCLSREERRAAIATRQVMPLAAALRTAHLRRGELVGARLCNGPKGFVYLLTLLARDGKVSRVTVDAAAGRPEGR